MKPLRHQKCFGLPSAIARAAPSSYFSVGQIRNVAFKVAMFRSAWERVAVHSPVGASTALQSHVTSNFPGSIGGAGNQLPTSLPGMIGGGYNFFQKAS